VDSRGTELQQMLSGLKTFQKGNPRGLKNVSRRLILMIKTILHY
jgi:hypothetical protein